MKPTKVVITIPLKGWSKHDSVEETCLVIKGMIAKLFDLREFAWMPFNTSNMTVEMLPREGPSKV
jgi:hypothetical protein